MARICKHGETIGTIDYLTKSHRYMSDGTLLRNTGFGWKLARVRPGVVIDAETFRATLARETE